MGLVKCVRHAGKEEKKKEGRKEGRKREMPVHEKKNIIQKKKKKYTKPVNTQYLL